jgi:hypothetical protein
MTCKNYTLLQDSLNREQLLRHGKKDEVAATLALSLQTLTAWVR